MSRSQFHYRGRIAATLFVAILSFQPSPCAAQDGGWTSLDEQVQALTASVAEADSTLEIDAYAKFSYRRSEDAVYTLDADTFEDQGTFGGFGFDSIGISVAGERGPASGKIGYNPDRRRLRSTYVALEFLDRAKVTIGRFKAPFLRSRLVRTTRLLFLDRSIQAGQTGPRDEGVKLAVDVTKNVELILSAQNGDDGLGDDMYLVGRLNVDVLHGGVENYEGAYGASKKAALSLGLAVTRDETLSDGQFEAFDFAFTRGRFGLAGEALSYPGDAPSIPGAPNPDVDNTYRKGLIDPLSTIAWTDTDPTSLTASWMLVPKKWEVAARWEELDDANDTKRVTLGLNRYVKGHNVKWQINFIDVRTDNPLLESELIGVGLVFRF